MNLTAEEFALRSYVRFEYERERGRTCEGESVECEVAERVSDQMTFIDFHSADYVRAVSKKKVCACVYDCVREGAQVAARCAQICFRSVRYMLRRSAFCSAVKRDYDDVNLALRFCNNSFGVLNVQNVKGDGIEGEGEQRYPATLYSHVRDVALIAARMFNSKLVQNLHAAQAPCFAKVRSMVVRKAHHIEADIFQILSITGRHAKHVAESRARSTLRL